MAGDGGIKTAVALALEDRAAEAAGAQAELFADADDAPMPLAPAARKAGRPAGARNRSTEEWRRHILSRYASPLVGLLEIAARPMRDLALELELFVRTPEGAIVRDEHGEPLLMPGALLDALRMQRGCLEAALPYLHQRQPLAVEAVGDGLRGGQMIVQIGHVDGGSHDHALPVIGIEENQRVSDPLPVQSHDVRSDGER